MTTMHDRSRRRMLAAAAAIGAAAGMGQHAAAPTVAAGNDRSFGGGQPVQHDMDGDTTRRLIDELEIRRVVDGIDSAVDAKAWDACRAYFTETIDGDFTSLAGGSPATIPADALVGGWRRNLYAEKKSLHMRSNHHILIDGDSARVTSKGYAFNQLPSPVGSDLWEVWGEYRHALVRTADGWKVSSMALTVLYTRGNERARDFVPGA